MTIEGLGKKFQEARFARGLTLDEAARLTKIRPSRLAEIEADDFSQFPSLAYAKGFLLIYGKFLDVDVTPYLDVFETSREVTVDGYSYLQDQPAPKPRRVRPTRAPTVRRQRVRSGDRRSPLPVLIGVGVIVAGFILMRLIMNIQRISPHQMVGVPQPTASVEASPAQAAAQQPPPPKAPPQQTAQPQAPAASVAPAPVAQAPSRAPSQAPVAQAPSRAPYQAPVAMVEATKKPALPVTTPAQSIPIPEAFVPAFANASAAAKVSAAQPKEPEVRRAEPVRPEDLAKAGAAETTQKPVEAQGPNQIAIKPLKKTYIKVVVDNGSQQPAFERWISPADGTVEFRGQKIAVRVLDRDAIQIKKNGKPIGGGDEDVTVE
ncbi:MAG TPA: helix-turn-helix domain-containing protein [Chthoniobacterales bacterium]|jgi:cytoskeletal protein RodZ|nr:helix-turn-helix domain-containing protein [Chthoniobacterales bacterium]